jgi:hypothetical protein
MSELTAVSNPVVSLVYVLVLSNVFMSLTCVSCTRAGYDVVGRGVRNKRLGEV